MGSFRVILTVFHRAKFGQKPSEGVWEHPRRVSSVGIGREVLLSSKIIENLRIWKASAFQLMAPVVLRRPLVKKVSINRSPGEESAAWKGAASRACGARGGSRDYIGGAAAPPNPPALFFSGAILTFFVGLRSGCVLCVLGGLRSQNTAFWVN